jgi:hypothetical protein
MTIKALYPNVRPTLSLNFARTKALDPRITFTRASTATFVGSNGLIQTAASGAARFDHNPATGESLGLLVEEARTNAVTYSEQFDNAAWTKNAVTVTANAVAAPDGTTTADMITANGASAEHIIYSTGVAAGLKTGSVYAKAGTNNFIQLTFGSSDTVYANFDLSNGTVGTVGVTSVASIQALSNGWYRCSLHTTSTIASNIVVVIVSSTTATRSQSNSLATSVYVWGAQVEASATFPTSYIPTTTATVTRAADVATIQGSNWLNIWNTGGAGNSIYAEANIAYTTTAPFPGGPVMYAMDGDTGGGTDKVWYSYLEAARGPTDGTGGGGGAVELFHAGVTSRGPGTFKSCMTFDVPNNRLQSSWNTVLATAAASAAYYNNMWALGANPRLTIGGKDLGSNRHAWCGCIKRMAIYSIGLPDAQLQALTAT